MSSELIELGQKALASVSSNVATGAPLIKCKLLASEFYEALRHELQKAPADSDKQTTLIAAANRCHRIAIASRSPGSMLSELQKLLSYWKSRLQRACPRTHRQNRRQCSA
jgi:hypothetical protein